ncbi:hypothetical protein ACF0H5_014001 [Mactra antiquata]
MPALSERPQILERGSWTKAAPIKEKKHHCHVSDSIGNNYSPNARNLTTSYIYETHKTRYGSTRCFTTDRTSVKITRTISLYERLQRTLIISGLRGWFT